ncbi:hypothetical protein HanRHA438_Chr14g0659691 [Helianthus annuus]|nr:hypothetical protein HanRHA438_Chr14g0659691 [Helianthus annuus]
MHLNSQQDIITATHYFLFSIHIKSPSIHQIKTQRERERERERERRNTDTTTQRSR